MQDELFLLLVIVGLYLGECFLWIPRNSSAFFHWVRGWRISFAGTILGNANGALAMANPLPPLGVAARSEPLPCSLSPEGILSFNSAAFSASGRKPQTVRFLRWEEIRTISLDGKKLFLNDEFFLKAISSSRAAELAGVVKKVKDLPEAKREKEISGLLGKSLTVADVKERWAAFAKEKTVLQIGGNILFAFLFLLVPVLVWQLGLVRIFWWILGGLLAQTIFIAVLFWRRHKRLFPQGGDERLTPFFTMLLAPPSAIRAIDFLARNLFERFHPLAPGSAFLPENDFERLAVQVARDLEFPLLPLPSKETEGGQCEEWFRQKLRERMIAEIPFMKTAFEKVRSTPARIEPENKLYCPRCLQQFTSGAERCIDCGGRELLALP